MKPERKRRVSHLEQRHSRVGVTAQAQRVMALLAQRVRLPHVSTDEEARIVHQMALDLVAEHQAGRWDV